SQMARPVNPGDERIASVEDAREIARFSSSPVIVQTHSGEINLIVPSGAKTRSIPVTEKVAIDIHAQNIDPVYAGYSFQETRDMKQEVFMLRVRPALRGKYRAADFMNIPNRSDILRVEKSVPASMKRQGIDLKDIKVAVVPTKFKNVSLATVSAKGYKDIMAQQKKAASPVSGEKIYFMEGEKGKVTFLRFSSDRKNPLGWKTKEIVTAPELISRMYEGDVTIFARNRELIDQATAFELFENKSYFKYHGNMVNFTNALDMSESERGGFLKAVDLIDEQLSDTFGSNQPKVKGSWKVLKGVRVARDTKNTADLVSVKGVGIVLDISEDLAKTRDPERIRMRLRNMTVKQWNKEIKTQELSSGSRGLAYDGFQGVEKTKDKGIIETGVNWMSRKFMGKVRGGPFKGMQIKTKGFDYLRGEFAQALEARELSNLVMAVEEMQNSSGIKQAASPVQPQYALDTNRRDHREFAQQKMRTEGIKAASSAITMASAAPDFERKPIRQEGQRDQPFTSPIGLTGFGTAERPSPKTAASPVMAERTSLQSDTFREMNRGPPAAVSVPTIIPQLPSISSPIVPTRILPAAPMITPAVTPILSRTTQTPRIDSASDRLAKVQSASPVRINDRQAASKYVDRTRQMAASSPLSFKERISPAKVMNWANRMDNSLSFKDANDVSRLIIK
ncbi:MAG: hypothetical protein KAR31_13895, partial [Candidatus Omnitrophica bacterium]|nr:hypothetical protein [Candidatus Omnitrophota bacterium]